MNIITADFNWISLLLIVGGAVFSIIKASKKNDTMPVFQNTDFETEGDIDHIFPKEENVIETGNRYTVTEKPEEIHPLKEDNSIQVISKQEEIELNSTIGDEEEFQLDIRQAIIGSEILRRPEY